MILAKGRKLYDVIEMTSKRLVTKKHTDLSLERIGYQHDPEQSKRIAAVAEQFLRHQAGLTPNTEAALKQFIEDAFLL